MPFQKGHKKIAGRAQGTHNKNYVDPNFWMGLLDQAMTSETDKEKIEIIFRALTLIFTKIQSLPSTPGDSLGNALRAQEYLNSIEVPFLKAEPLSLEGNSVDAVNP